MKNDEIIVHWVNAKINHVIKLYINLGIDDENILG